MKIISNRDLLNGYIEKYNILSCFGNDVSDCLRLHVYERGEYLFKAGEVPIRFLFMVEGKAKVVAALMNGRSLLLRFYKPFTVLGDMELLSGVKATCDVQAISKTVCVGISYESLRKNSLEDPVFLSFIGKNLGEKLAKNSTFSAINTLYPLENRLASYILATSDANGKSPEESEIYTDKNTELAELLGTSYRHLCRTLDKLVRKGIIEKSGRGLIILNRNGLEKLAGELYE